MSRNAIEKGRVIAHFPCALGYFWGPANTPRHQHTPAAALIIQHSVLAAAADMEHQKTKGDVQFSSLVWYYNY